MNIDRGFESCRASRGAPEPSAVPKLLVSVRDSEEVLKALAGGADWIDLKEPNAGPLAAVSYPVAQAAVQSLAGRRTLSAALGELRDWHNAPARELLTVEGLEVVKLGLAGCARQCDWQQQWQAVAIAANKSEKQLVAVVYADWQQVDAPSPTDVLLIAQHVGSRFLLIDTYDKSKGSTFEHLSDCELGQILQGAKRAGLTTVLAGSLTTALIGQLPLDAVDMVAVRGAVCLGDRTQRIDADLIEKFRTRLAARFADNRRSRHRVG